MEDGHFLLQFSLLVTQVSLGVAIFRQYLGLDRTITKIKVAAEQNQK